MITEETEGPLYTAEIEFNFRANAKVRIYCSESQNTKWCLGSESPPESRG